VNRARLAGEAGAEAGEHRQHRRKRLAEPRRGIAIVLAGRRILRERDGVRDLVRPAVERRGKVVSLEHRDQPLMQRGDAAGVERELLARFIAHPQHDRMAAKVERQREGAASAGRRRQRGEPARVGLKRDVPAVIDPGRVGDPHLSDHLRRKVQDGERLVVALDA
jgi:hypothetical protein